MSRIKPGFEPDSYEAQNKGQEPLSCTWLLIISIGGYFIFRAINRVMAGYGSNLEQITCYGILICLVTLFALKPYFERREKSQLQKKRMEWKRTCTSAEVAILKRNYYAGGTSEDEYGISHSRGSSYHLDLEVSADQKAVAPNQTMVGVKVRMMVYAQLQDRNTVRIYYKPESPMTFLLEEELQ